MSIVVREFLGARLAVDDGLMSACVPERARDTSFDAVSNSPDFSVEVSSFPNGGDAAFLRIAVFLRVFAFWANVDSWM